MKHRIVFFVFVVGVFLNWVFIGGGNAAEKSELTQPLFQSGLALYSQQCMACHGALGQGDGTAAYLLNPKPRDFSRGTFRLVSTEQGKPTDQDLFETISRGMLGSSMPPWDHLSGEERWSLVYAVRYFSGLKKGIADGKISENEALTPKWESAKEMIEKESQAGSIVSLSNEPPATERLLATGKELYQSACASCHGVDGKGNVPQNFKDESGYPLAARDFTQGLFKGGSMPRDVAIRLKAGIPGSPMPSYSAAFNDEQIWGLSQYVQTFVPSGKKKDPRQKKTVISVKKVAKVPTTLNASIWKEAKKVELALMPLWWHSPRITHVRVEALCDDESISFRLRWEDETQNISQSKPQLFSDAVSLQLSKNSNPPFFAMGDAKGAVNLWLWKGALPHPQKIEETYPNMSSEPMYLPFKNKGKNGEEAELAPEDSKRMTASAVGNPLLNPDSKSSVQDLNAKGFGTLTLQKLIDQNVQGKGEWKKGVWQALFTRKLISDGEGDVAFAPGQEIPIAFAVWDGEAKERNGQKSVTIWHTLKLE